MVYNGVMKKLTVAITVTALTISILSGPLLGVKTGARGKSAPKSKPNSESAVPKDMVKIQPGEFDIGCSIGDRDCFDYEKPSRRITITKGFYIDKFEVTQGKYREIMGASPSCLGKCGEKCPVECVTWYDAEEFCGKSGKRLPTEAEWEYAARANSKTRYFWGGMVKNDYLWHKDNAKADYEGNVAGFGKQPVGLKKPNGFGLYDMEGNVWEWTRDCWQWNWYREAPPVDPVNASPQCKARVLRGGSWFLDARMNRVSMRNGYDPERYNYFTGFRCAKDLPWNKQLNSSRIRQ